MIFEEITANYAYLLTVQKTTHNRVLAQRGVVAGPLDVDLIQNYRWLLARGGLTHADLTIERRTRKRAEIIVATPELEED